MCLVSKYFNLEIFLIELKCLVYFPPLTKTGDMTRPVSLSALDCYLSPGLWSHAFSLQEIRKGASP